MIYVTLSAHSAIVRSRLCLAINSSNRLASLPNELQRCNCQSSDLLPKNANCLASTCQSNSVCELNIISQVSRHFLNSLFSSHAGGFQN